MDVDRHILYIIVYTLSMLYIILIYNCIYSFYAYCPLFFSLQNQSDFLTPAHCDALDISARDLLSIHANFDSLMLDTHNAVSPCRAQTPKRLEMYCRVRLWHTFFPYTAYVVLCPCSLT